MNQDLYSEPLSPEVKTRMVPFLETLLEAIKAQANGEESEIAKQQLLALLDTDIDIITLSMVIASIFHMSSGPLLTHAILGGNTSRETAEAFVRILQAGRTLANTRRNL